MRRLLFVLVAFLLAACGSAPAPTAGTTPQAQATVPLDPTLTVQERDAVQVVRVRGRSMITAAQELLALSREIRATTAWKSKVFTAADVITAGQGAIKNVTLSDYYAPLNKHTQDIATNCAKPAEEIQRLDVDRLSIAFLKTQQEALQRWCITEMDRLLQLSYESLK